MTRAAVAWRNVAVVVAVLILAARLFTGIVYEYDDPTTYLVLKHTPSLAVEQRNGAGAQVRARFTIIDGGENELAYQGVYVAGMRWAFAACVGSLGVAALLGRRRGHR